MRTLTTLLLITIFLTVISTITAQESELKRGSLHSGYVVTLKGDTLHGFLLNTNLWLNQHQTYFYTDTLDKKGRVKYTPKELTAYLVGSRHYVSMQYPFVYSVKKQNFILRKQHGAIDLFIWYYNPDRGKLMSPDITLVDLSKALIFNEDELWTNIFAIKNGGDFTELTGLKFLMKFAKKMSDYVADEPEIATKILNKTPGYLGIEKDIERIVIEYNQLKTY